MQSLSSLTNYRHSNIYTQRNKIALALRAMADIQTRQYTSGKIEIPASTLMLEITKAKKLLAHTDREIRFKEKTDLPFGHPFSD